MNRTPDTMPWTLQHLYRHPAPEPMPSYELQHRRHEPPNPRTPTPMEINPEKQALAFYEERKGHLPFMVTWLSLDGRPQTRYYETKETARQHEAHLRSLGRQPKVWLDVSAHDPLA